jgi:Putative beta-lactamase-inhibitor-like, PepSY-like
MRSIILIVLAVFACQSISIAQSKAITAAFQQKFPTATKVKWEKENDTEYEANFNMNGLKYSANYSTKGEWLETESPIAFDKLPPKVTEAFQALHKNQKVKSASLIETSSGTTKYELEYRKGLKMVELFYDENGNELK